MITIQNQETETRERLLSAIKNRFSPRAFSPEELDENIVSNIFEAARCAPSSYNEQPWRYRLLYRGSDDYVRLLGSLAPSNRQWAQNAPLLIIGYFKKTFTLTGEPNYYNMYDLGQSAAYLSLQAQEFNIYTHQMGGFNRLKVNEEFNIGDEFEAAVVIAMGRIDEALIGAVSTSAVEAKRKRKSLDEILI